MNPCCSPRLAPQSNQVNLRLDPDGNDSTPPFGVLLSSAGKPGGPSTIWVGASGWGVLGVFLPLNLSLKKRRICVIGEKRKPVVGPQRQIGIRSSVKHATGATRGVETQVTIGGAQVIASECARTRYQSGYIHERKDMIRCKRIDLILHIRRARA
jgi:hypothetical protein